MTPSARPLEVIDIPEHCGNAPRKVVLRDALIALYQRDSTQLLDRLHPEVHWEIMGSTVLQGLSAVESWLATQPVIRALHLSTIITHGTDCGADGTLHYDDGRAAAFSHVFVFAGHAKTAKIKNIRTYIVALDDAP